MSHLEEDPQLTAIIHRVNLFKTTVSDQADRIAAVRDELDGLWVTRRGADSEDLSWVFRPRIRRDERRSA